MMTILFVLLYVFAIVWVLALFTNAKRLDEKEFKEYERDLKIKHLEDYNP
jgi:hypothetical protein